MVKRRGGRHNSDLQVLHKNRAMLFAERPGHFIYQNVFCLDNFRELGIGIVAYSPLGRGFFSKGSKLVETLSDQDFRKVSFHAVAVTLVAT